MNIVFSGLLTQMVRLPIAKRILLVARNVHRWQQRETRRDQRLQASGHWIARMEQIVHLMHTGFTYVTRFLSRRGDLPIR